MLQKSADEVVRSLFFAPLSRTGNLSMEMGGMILHKRPPSATPLFHRRAPVLLVNLTKFLYTNLNIMYHEVYT